jgi:hypothetical protein
MNQENKTMSAKGEEISPAIRMIKEENDSEQKRKKRRRKTDRLSDRKTHSNSNPNLETEES